MILRHKANLHRVMSGHTCPDRELDHDTMVLYLRSQSVGGEYVALYNLSLLNKHLKKEIWLLSLDRGVRPIVNIWVGALQSKDQGATTSNRAYCTIKEFYARGFKPSLSFTNYMRITYGITIPIE